MKKKYIELRLHFSKFFLFSTMGVIVLVQIL